MPYMSVISSRVPCSLCTQCAAHKYVCMCITCAIMYMYLYSVVISWQMREIIAEFRYGENMRGDQKVRQLTVEYEVGRGLLDQNRYTRT